MGHICRVLAALTLLLTLFGFPALSQQLGSTQNAMPALLRQPLCNALSRREAFCPAPAPQRPWVQQDVPQQQRSAVPARRTTRLQVLSTPRGGTAASEQQQTKRAVVVAVDASEVLTLPALCHFPAARRPRWRRRRGSLAINTPVRLRPAAAPVCCPGAPCRTAWWPSITCWRM